MERYNYLKISEILKLVPISRHKLSQMIDSEEFPRPINFGGKTMFWKKDSVNSWIEEKLNQ